MIQLVKNPKVVAAVVAASVAALSSLWPEHKDVFMPIATLILGKEWFAQWGKR